MGAGSGLATTAAEQSPGSSAGSMVVLTVAGLGGSHALGRTRRPIHPAIIQGGMGVAVSGWRLAKAVSSLGQLGVVSGTALDIVLVRRLQQGDPEGRRHGRDCARARAYRASGRPTDARTDMRSTKARKVSRSARERGGAMPRSAVHGCELPGLRPHRSLAARPWAPRRRPAGGRISAFAPHRAPWAASLSVKLGPLIAWCAGAPRWRET